ncbi:hypothetical protein ABFY09_13835 [Marinomonas sp. 5E14-1]|uniref:hypothetical protein n=1 Tax=Marinomonas sp. 5E14-1 TaxID=3153922 RepID=UPI003264B82F
MIPTAKKHLIGLLISSGVALTVCSNSQASSNTTPNDEASVSAEMLQSSFEKTALAHRKPGDIEENSFEAKLRDSIRSELNIDFGYLKNAQESELLLALIKEDTHLAHFKHASHHGSDLEQLWALLPALPTLEQRKAIKVALNERFDETPNLPNDKMAELMDLQLNRLFGGFTVSLDALTLETEQFESLLVDGLKSEGLNISARHPSLTLEYFIETYTDQGEVELIADFEFKDRSARTFHTLSHETTYSSNDGDQAQKNAFSSLANDISKQLLEKATTRINNVNNVK